MTNKVVATYPDNTTRVIFNTTEPYLTEKEMTDLVTEFEIEKLGNNRGTVYIIKNKKETPSV